MSKTAFVLSHISTKADVPLSGFCTLRNSSSPFRYVAVNPHDRLYVFVALLMNQYQAFMICREASKEWPDGMPSLRA